MSETFEYNVEIKTGESKTLQQRFDLPTKMSGFSLEGDYGISIRVWVNNGCLLPEEKMSVYLST